MVSIHLATVTPNSRSYCEEPTRREESSTDEESCSEKDLEETHQNNDDQYVVDKTVIHADSGPRLKYVVQ